MSDISWCNSETCFIMNRHRHIEERIIEFAHVNEDIGKVVVTAFKIDFTNEAVSDE